MKDIELNYVKRVLQGGRPSETAVDWYGIYGFTQLNKIGGYFYRRLVENGITVPARVEKQYIQLLKRQTERNAVMGTRAEEIGEALERENVRYAFLKGNVLSHADFHPLDVRDNGISLYYCPGERISNDIDLLVEPKDVGKVEKILFALGYTQGYYDDATGAVRTLTRREILERRMNRGETVPFQMLTDNVCLPHVEIDINFSLDYLPGGTGGTLSKMLEQSRLYETDNGGMLRSLGEIDFLIHLLLHQYKEMRVYSMVMRGKDLELYKLLDIYLMMKKADVHLLWDRVTQYGVITQAAVVLKTVRSVFDDLELTDKIEKVIDELDGEAEFVIEPDKKNKRYVWAADIWERLKRFDHTEMLAEV